MVSLGSYSDLSREGALPPLEGTIDTITSVEYGAQSPMPLMDRSLPLVLTAQPLSEVSIVPPGTRSLKNIPSTLKLSFLNSPQATSKAFGGQTTLSASARRRPSSFMPVKSIRWELSNMSSLPFMGESVMCSLHAITPMKMIGDEDDDLYQIDVMELTARDVESSSLHREYLQVGQLMGEYR